jgi:hypothetical protein
LATAEDSPSASNVAPTAGFEQIDHLFKYETTQELNPNAEQRRKLIFAPRSHDRHADRGNSEL